MNLQPPACVDVRWCKPEGQLCLSISPISWKESLVFHYLLLFQWTIWRAQALTFLADKTNHEQCLPSSIFIMNPLPERTLLLIDRVFSAEREAYILQSHSSQSWWNRSNLLSREQQGWLPTCSQGPVGSHLTINPTETVSDATENRLTMKLINQENPSHKMFWRHMQWCNLRRTMMNCAEAWCLGLFLRAGGQINCYCDCRSNWLTPKLQPGKPWTAAVWGNESALTRCRPAL